jgi:predicted nucleic acid-binding Zn ribbon protein
MKNYDDWKTEAPEDEPEFECSECGTPVEKEGQYCSNACFKASQL